VVASTTEFAGAIICGSVNTVLGSVQSGSVNTDTLTVNASISGAATSINITSAAQSNSLTAVNNTITSSGTSSLIGSVVTLGSSVGGGVINVGGLADSVWVSGIPFAFYFQQYL
jgi:hypothetical protein